ncbi:MAG: TauD/TfdA family dioxygenase [Rhizobiales bacterium]|nr:TauD/TfdA family dioxygenase [Hyphomicrobiales bacterium]
MTLKIQPSGQACGATVTGIDLSQTQDAATIATLRGWWLQHHVLAFPDQTLSDDDLERVTRCFGQFSVDPFIAPIPGREHVIAVERKADETGPIFAEAWHSDWSFLATPPDGTLLYSITIPKTGGDTLFANQQLAWSGLLADRQAHYRDVIAVHSARRAYSPEGFYGKDDAGRSMTIRPSVSAEAVQHHRLVRPHPETGRPALFGCAGYIVDLEGCARPASEELEELLNWQTQDRFVYRHRWEEGTLVMWDNRSVLHKATGGYDGHARLLHRTTIGAM